MVNRYKHDAIPNSFWGRSQVTVLCIPENYALILQDIAELMELQTARKPSNSAYGFYDVIVLDTVKNGRSIWARNSNFMYSMCRLEVLIHNFITTMAIKDITKYRLTKPELYNRILKAVKNSNYNMAVNVLRNEKTDFIQIRPMHPLEKVSLGMTFDEVQYQWIAEKQQDSNLIVQQFLTEWFQKNRIDVPLIDFAENYYDVFSRIKITESGLLKA